MTEERSPTRNGEPFMSEAEALARKVSMGHVFNNAAEVYDATKTLAMALIVARSETETLTDEAREARRYRAWRDGDVVVRRSGDGWEAKHRDDPHWDVGSWTWAYDLDIAIDEALAKWSKAP